MTSHNTPPSRGPRVAGTGVPGAAAAAAAVAGAAAAAEAELMASWHH
jgi:hypothetical protein